MHTSLYAHGVAVDVTGVVADVHIAQIRGHTRGKQLGETAEVGERLVLQLAREVAHDHDVEGLALCELVRALLALGEALLWHKERVHGRVRQHGADRLRPGREVLLQLVKAGLQLLLGLFCTLRGRGVRRDVGQGGVLHRGLKPACHLAAKILEPGAPECDQTYINDVVLVSSSGVVILY